MTSQKERYRPLPFSYQGVSTTIEVVVLNEYSLATTGLMLLYTFRRQPARCDAEGATAHIVRRKSAAVADGHKDCKEEFDCLGSNGEIESNTQNPVIKFNAKGHNMELYILVTYNGTGDWRI